MEIINHFSHKEHPLILKELKEGDTEEVCYGCQQPVSGSTYCCSECEKVFLHKSCAELPLEITLPIHPEHPLKLFSDSPYLMFGDSECNICLKCWNGFTYHCSKCEFDVDVLCAQLHHTYKHPGHQHPLKLQRRSALFQCDACYIKEEDQSYYCTVCSFWIHKTCGSLPSSMSHKDHPHGPLYLAYCLPEEYRHYNLNCDICREKLHPSYWYYSCGPCRYFAHLKCITKQDDIAEADSAVEIPPNTINLPADVVSSQLIRHFLKEKGLPLIEQSKEINHVSHHHPLILTNIQDDYYELDDDDQETVCSGCVEPISGSCYGCVQCNYFIHLHCAQLPNSLSSSYHPEHELSIGYYPECFRFVKCSRCKRICNGFFYECKECNILLDINCALLPSTIKHEAHNHLLVQGRYFNVCNACNDYHGYRYRANHCCKRCNYTLGFQCTMLPQVVRHRWDKHPLILSFPPFHYHPDPFMCDICEKEIHPKFWLYHCRECDNSFHPRCVPRLGKRPKMKFGGKIQIEYHPHPLTFVREVKYKFRCDKCGDDLEGGMGFECEPCYFNLCLPCVEKIVDSRSEESRPKEHSEVEESSGEESDLEEHSEVEESSGEESRPEEHSKVEESSGEESDLEEHSEEILSD